MAYIRPPLEIILAKKSSFPLAQYWQKMLQSVNIKIMSKEDRHLELPLIQMLVIKNNKVNTKILDGF